LLSFDDAQAQTGISPQQVSKWAKRLADKPKYRAALYGAAWQLCLSQPYAIAAAVLRDKFHAGAFQRGADGFKSILRPCKLFRFEVGDCVSMNARSLR